MLSSPEVKGKKSLTHQARAGTLWGQSEEDCMHMESGLLLAIGIIVGFFLGEFFNWLERRNA